MKIVLGYVPTEVGEAALRSAVAEARLRDAELVVVHSRKTADVREVEEVIEERAELEDVEERLEASGVPFQIRDFVRGNTPAEDLVETAKEVGGELIVIGLRRRSPTGKFLLGSNASDILLAADCPVLAVKANGAAG